MSQGIEEEREPEITNARPKWVEKFNSLIDNWTHIAEKDRKKIIDYLGSEDKKISKSSARSDVSIESLIKQDEVSVKFDLKGFQTLNMSEESRHILKNILQQQDKNPTLEYKNQFNAIAFHENIASGSISEFHKREQSTNSKQELLNGVSQALEQEEKKLAQSTSVLHQVKAKKSEIMSGKKVQSVLNKFMDTDSNGKKESINAGKMDTRHQNSLNPQIHKQKVKLLRDLKQYIQQEKSEEVDFKKLNNVAKTLYDYHRNEIVGLRASQKKEEEQKKIDNVDMQLQPYRDNPQTNEIINTLTKLQHSSEKREEEQKRRSLENKLQSYRENPNTTEVLGIIEPLVERRRSLRNNIEKVHEKINKIEKEKESLLWDKEKILGTKKTFKEIVTEKIKKAGKVLKNHGAKAEVQSEKQNNIPSKSREHSIFR